VFVPQAPVSFKKYMPPPLPYLSKEEEGKEEEGAYIFLMKQVPVVCSN
jgi:hypothetical protein